MTIPNLITIARLLMVPIVVVMILLGDWPAAFIVFVIAGISDGLDGFIARHFNMRSEFGAHIDPLADKALMISIYVTLALAGHLPTWFAFLVVFRDVMILAAVVLSWLMARPMQIKPLLISKLNTAAQIGYASLILASKSFDIQLGIFNVLSLTIVSFLTLSSSAVYLANWLRHMEKE